MQSTTRIFLVRHAETEWNRAGRFQGQQDSPLTDHGVAQARAVAARLRTLTFSALYSSDQGRSLVTAAHIQSATGHPIRQDARLRERAYGLFEGITPDEAAARHPDVYDAYVRTRDATFRLPGGESRGELLARGRTALAELAQRHAGETIVAVSHGGFLTTLLAHILGVPPETRRGFVIVNCSLSVVVQDASQWLVECLGDTCHLRGPEADQSALGSGIQP